MGILSINSELEDFFHLTKVEWSKLKDRQYREFIIHWREAFEENLANGIVQHGNHAFGLLESKLSFSGFIFNCPNYKYLPVTENSERGGYTFAYKVNELATINRALFNTEELIICSENFDFMCAFNHEAPELIPEIYCEIPYE